MDSRGFAPIARADAAILILGSLPGQESLRQRRYYAQPRNAFWRIMGALYGAGPELGYGARVRRLRAAQVAVWDVCAAAWRPGSLDSAIDPASIVTNDFGAFYRRHPRIGLVCFNGATAATLYRRRVLPTLAPECAALPMLVLPSTSPAHASLSPAEKLARWRQATTAAARRP